MDRRKFLNGLAAGGAITVFAPSLHGHGIFDSPLSSSATPSSTEGASLDRDGLKFWLESSYRRVYPGSPAGNKDLPSILAARNEQISFQACFKNTNTDSALVRCEVIDVPADWVVNVRRVGFVPLPHFNTFTPKEDLEGAGFIPGLCPDPLFPENSVHVGPDENGVFWITCKIPAGTSPGEYKLNVKLTLENSFSYVDWTRLQPWSVELPVTIDVKSLVIKPRRDFPATNWISADSIWQYYKLEPCCDRFWELTDKFIEDIIKHNINVIYTPLFNIRHEILERPAQLLKVRRTGPDQYEFDFSDVRKWVSLAVKHGAKYIEWPHFFTPAPTSGKYPQRIYERTDSRIGEMLWTPETSATSDTYRKFLDQFMPEFKAFLKEEGIFKMSLFHCADEPDGDVQIADYRKARTLLREVAPWMEVIDAMSDVRFATEKLTDMPVPSITSAAAFKSAGCPSWVYFCCGPRDKYLQRLLDTPLSKIRMTGWLFYALDAKGFLHWAYNYWMVFCTGTPLDPFQDSSTGMWPGMPYGDAFVVYPGPDGPIDSVRWEVFAESLQDYALLQSAGIKKDDPLFAGIKDYNVFPFSEEWIRSTREKILSRY